jgi:hypothetical protein
MSNSPNILTLDIETFPLESYTWGTWDQNVGLEQIKTEWSIASVAAKWIDSKKVIYADTGGRGKGKVRDDTRLLAGIWKLLDEADWVIAQNGVQFDIKKIDARLITLGFGPYSPIRVIDTLSVAKRRFAFTSNKLAWMSKHLTTTKKQEHKEFPGFELWKECLNDNPRAWAVMKKYNIADVLATEELYLRMRPWIVQHPSMSVYTDDEDPSCPKCGEENLQARGYAYTQQGKYQRYQCTDCSGWSRGKTNLLTKDKRKQGVT